MKISTIKTVYFALALLAVGAQGQKNLKEKKCPCFKDCVNREGDIAAKVTECKTNCKTSSKKCKKKCSKGMKKVFKEALEEHGKECKSECKADCKPECAPAPECDASGCNSECECGDDAILTDCKKECMKCKITKMKGCFEDCVNTATTAETPGCGCDCGALTDKKEKKECLKNCAGEGEEQKKCMNNCKCNYPLMMKKGNGKGSKFL